MRLNGNGHRYNNIDQITEEDAGAPDRREPPEPPILSPKMSTSSPLTRTATQGSFERRAADLREVEKLKATIRTMERKLKENSEKMRSFDSVKVERDKFENVVQALQRKLQTSQQDIVDLRERCQAAEMRVVQVDSRDGEHESAMEMAALDKEMAEERADSMEAGLEALKIRHEELELEAEILREENQELGSVMSPEEKASAGWVQMEREKERLKQALITLRDMAHQTEADLKSHVKELEFQVQDFNELSTKFQDTTERLSKAEATNTHLMEQLEAVESNDDIQIALQQEKEDFLEQIEAYKKQLEGLQEEVDVNNELEAFHLTSEKDLQNELDERQALLNESEHANIEQSKLIEDFEYTLGKFRELASAQQTAIDEMRRSQNISESEAHEMQAKSRAIMDLNLKLQNSVSKTQMKAIDVELDRMKAEESAQHLSIVQMFVTEHFSLESQPIIAFMCLKRIKFKASIACSVLRDRTKDSQALIGHNIFNTFDALDRLAWISTTAERFIQFISSCSPEDFTRFEGAKLELEPIERTTDTWIELLRRDELYDNHAARDLHAMIAVMSDMAEKLITHSLESKAGELAARTLIVEGQLETSTAELGLIQSIVRSSTTTETGSDEAQQLVKRLDLCIGKARTMQTVCGKVSKQLRSRRSEGLALTEPSWIVFDSVQRSTNELAHLLRTIGADLLLQVNDEDRSSSVPHQALFDLFSRAADRCSQQSSPGGALVDDGLLYVSSVMQHLHMLVDQMHHTSTDLANTAEVEQRPAPWVLRSKELRARKIIPPDTEELLRKLKSQVEGQVVTLAAKDKQLEENSLKIDLLESRTKESRLYNEQVQKLQAELETSRRVQEKAEADLEDSRREHSALTERLDVESAALRKLQTASAEGGHKQPSVTAARDETTLSQLNADLDYLRSEILGLQSAIRYLKTENHRLKVPSSTSIAAANSWLSPAAEVRPRPSRTSPAAAESSDALDRLLELSSAIKPVTLAFDEPSATKTSWRAAKSTPRYQVLQQREELEKWSAWKDDLVKRAKFEQRVRAGKGSRVGHVVSVKKTAVLEGPGTPEHQTADGVTIVGSPP